MNDTNTSTPDVARFWLLEHIEDFDGGSTALGLSIDLEKAKQFAMDSREWAHAAKKGYVDGWKEDVDYKQCKQWVKETSSSSQFTLSPITINDAVSSPAVSIAMAILRGESWAIDLALDVASRGG